MRLIRGLRRHTVPPGSHMARTDPLDKGLVGEWRFDRNTGLRLPDCSGRSNHGIITGATWTGSPYGTVLDFNNSDVTIGDVELIIQAFTIELFVKRHVAANQGYIVAKVNTATPSWAYAVHLDGSGATTNNLFIGINGGANWQIAWHAGLTTYMPTNVWTHNVWTRDGSDVHVYYDGLEFTPLGGNTIGGGDIPNTTVPVMFGDRENGGRAFDGEVALIRLYNRVLSASEVRCRYQICRRRAQELGGVWMLPWGRVPMAFEASLTTDLAQAISPVASGQAEADISLNISTASISTLGRAAGRPTLTLTVSKGIASEAAGQADAALTLTIQEAITAVSSAAAAAGVAMDIITAIQTSGTEVAVVVAPEQMDFTLYIDQIRALTRYIEQQRNITRYIDRQRSWEKEL